MKDEHKILLITFLFGFSLIFVANAIGSSNNSINGFTGFATAGPLSQVGNLLNNVLEIMADLFTTLIGAENISLILFFLVFLVIFNVGLSNTVFKDTNKKKNATILSVIISLIATIALQDWITNNFIKNMQIWSFILMAGYALLLYYLTKALANMNHALKDMIMMIAYGIPSWLFVDFIGQVAGKEQALISPNLLLSFFTLGFLYWLIRFGYDALVGVWFSPRAVLRRARNTWQSADWSQPSDTDVDNLRHGIEQIRDNVVVRERHFIEELQQHFEEFQANFQVLRDDTNQLHRDAQHTGNAFHGTTLGPIFNDFNDAVNAIDSNHLRDATSIMQRIENISNDINADLQRIDNNINRFINGTLQHVLRERGRGPFGIQHLYDLQNNMADQMGNIITPLNELYDLVESVRDIYDNRLSRPASRQTITSDPSNRLNQEIADVETFANALRADATTIRSNFFNRRIFFT